MASTEVPGPVVVPGFDTGRTQAIAGAASPGGGTSAGLGRLAAPKVLAGARVEWGTLGLMVGCYAVWAAGLWLLWPVAPVLAVIVTAVALGFHSSLTHEALHGHPFRSEVANELTVAAALAVVFPYRRYRDQHLAHHNDPLLTDPYDDPESNFLDPDKWAVMPRWKQVLFQWNNTLLGRIVIGPWIGTAMFLQGDWRLIRAGDRTVIQAWLLHIPAMILVLGLVALSPMPFWAYGLAIWAGLGLMKIRTYLEHRAHEKHRARTAIVEDRGPLAWLFLYNNLHVVHHQHPAVPWYQLPALYERSGERYRGMNEAYVYRSYGEVFRRYLVRAKDSVPHPLWRSR